MPTSGRSLPPPPAHLSSITPSSFRSYLNEAQSIASRKLPLISHRPVSGQLPSCCRPHIQNRRVARREATKTSSDDTHYRTKSPGLRTGPRAEPPECVLHLRTLRTRAALEMLSSVDCYRRLNQHRAIPSEEKWCKRALRSQFAWKAFPEYRPASCREAQSSDG